MTRCCHYVHFEMLYDSELISAERRGKPSQVLDVCIGLYWTANTDQYIHVLLVCIVSVFTACIQSVFKFRILYCACIEKIYTD
jgi:hypothetical protein